MKVFIDIETGDFNNFEIQQQSYTLGYQFYNTKKTQLGLSKDIDSLSEEDIEILEDSFQQDPNWTNKGTATFKKPQDIKLGTIIIDLFEKECPKTVENFKCLITGEKGVGKQSKKPLHYQNCPFHRVIKGFVCQGGDIVRGDGSGSDSIYGGKFNDEKPGLKLKHDKAGVVSMANSGQKNTNSSQFFITLSKATQCDAKHVVFGQVVSGLETLDIIDNKVATLDGTPQIPCRIGNTGIFTQ